MDNISQKHANPAIEQYQLFGVKWLELESSLWIDRWILHLRSLFIRFLTSLLSDNKTIETSKIDFNSCQRDLLE